MKSDFTISNILVVVRYVIFGSSKRFINSDIDNIFLFIHIKHSLIDLCKFLNFLTSFLNLNNVSSLSEIFQVKYVSQCTEVGRHNSTQGYYLSLNRILILTSQQQCCREFKTRRENLFKFIQIKIYFCSCGNW